MKKQEDVRGCLCMRGYVRACVRACVGGWAGGWVGGWVAVGGWVGLIRISGLRPVEVQGYKPHYVRLPDGRLPWKCLKAELQDPVARRESSP